MVGTKLNNLKIPTRCEERWPAAIYAEIHETWVRLADLYRELGRAISETRRRRLMTQSALAEAIGLSREQIAQYEIGSRWKHDPPGIEKIVRFLTGY